MSQEESEDDIVISGIAGRYPESSNINEFWEKLMSGKELSSIDDRRWPVGLHQLPKRTGKVPDAEKFDASFFKINDQEANWMDPQIRIFHETTYEAFADSGNDPASFRGSNTGVYIGWCYSDTDSALKEDEAKIIPYLQLASTRVSMAFGLKGISIGVDTACASSFTAFHQALCAMRSGVCDSALVGGWAIHLRPSLAVCFHQLMMISTDGRSKCMDAKADGYCRSEAIVSVLLQRRSAAKRVYATVLNAKTNTDGFKIEGITFPSIALQTQLMMETYSEAGVDPKDVDYVEAHMTGTAAGDPVESAAIAAVLCKDRKDGLLTGCLKSNMGHSEGASGLCAITKSCLAFQRRMLPPNIHFKVPNEAIDSLKTGQLKPVLEKRCYDGSLIGLNCFGFGGCNVHAIIRANRKVINEQSHKITTPVWNRLITYCGRTKDSIDALQTLIERNPDQITTDFCALLQGISSIPPENGMINRSYFIMNEDKKTISSRDVRIREKKPLTFILPGFGPSLDPMSSSMSKFDSYRRSKEKSMKLFKEIINQYNPEKKETKLVSTMFDIVSHQIAMIDFLADLNIHPDYVIGTSLGELSAAYQDKCLTLEQIIHSIILIGAKMENVVCPKEYKTYSISGISVEDALKGKPIPEFEIIAIYSGQNFLTSATEGAIATFMQRHKLKACQIRIQRVEMMSDVMHSSKAGPIDTELLAVLNREPSFALLSKKERSYKWLSTAIENENWYKNVKMNISYIAAMISSKVNLNQVYDYIPKDSTLIEISPFTDEKFSMRSILREGMGPDVSILSILPSSSSDELLSTFGELYLTGINPNVKSLYPAVKFPVSRETASISPLLKWKHDKSFLLTRTPDFFDYVKCNQPFQIDMMEPRYQYLAGHKVDGRILFPATGYLWLVWDIFAHIRGYKGEAGKAMLNVGAEFKEVEFKRATILPKNGSVTLNVLILTSLGRFTVTEGGTTCVTGYIRLCPADPSTEKLEKSIQVQDDGKEKIVLSPNDIYKDFKVRGYDYGPTFQGLQEAMSDGSSGKVKWIENWVSFSDSMFQLAIFGSETRQLLLPTYIDYMKCDIRALVKEVDKISSENGLITLTFDKIGNVGACPGMFIKGLKASPAPRRLNQKPLVELQTFTPYDQIIPLDEKKFKKLTKYDKVCANLVTKKLIDISWTDDEQEVVLKEMKNPKSVLLNLLNEAKSIQHLRELLENNEEEKHKLSDDTLLTSHDPGHMIRSQMDVIIENIQHGKKMSIYEISILNKNLIEQVKMILNSNSVPFDYHSLGKDASGKISYPNKQIDADLFVLQDFTLEFEYDLVHNQSELGSLTEHFHKTYEIMREGSFMMVMYRNKKWVIESLLSKLFVNETGLRKESLQEIVRTASKIGLLTIATKVDETTGLTTILLRKPSKEPSSEIEMVNVKLNEYEWVEELKEKLKPKDGESKRKKIWLVANDSSFNGIVGLVNTLRKEEGGSNIRCFFDEIDENNNTSGDNGFSMKELMAKDLTMNIIRNGQLGSYRYQIVDKIKSLKPVKDAFLDVETKGDLSSLTFYKSKELKTATVNCDLPDQQRSSVTMAKYEICYSALNFKDIMVASGRIPTNAYPQEAMKEGNLGMEFSGLDKNGNRIMGMTQTNAIATSIVTPDVLTWKVPDWMTLKDAATIPVAYVTVYYSLLIRGHLLPGERILIHAGAGAVGQAAINLSLSLGCTVFTTVGTRAKKEFIRKKFPSIPESRILNSRDVSFELEILRQTDGRGVDVILNSLAEDKMKASFRCLAEFGRFLEIGKYDIIQNNPFDRADFAENKTFHAICLAHLMHETFIEKSISSTHVVAKLKKLVDEGLKSGAVKPLTSHVFDKSCPEEAFRFVASGKHMGKVLLRMRPDTERTNNHDENIVPTINTETQSALENNTMEAVLRTYFDPDKSYIITGGLGGFGLELTYWLIERGARKIILTSRSGIKTPYQKLSMRRFKESGAHVQVTNHDISILTSATSLIKHAQQHGPLGGIFHLAMVLNDALFENLTAELFEKVCSPKVRGAINLDTATSEVKGCESLDYFVCFSSVACGRGNIGQANYSFANSAMERVCESRRAKGQPGLAIQWGAIGDVGIVADYMGGNDVLIGGTIPQRMPSCFEVLDVLLQSSIGSVLSSIVLADHKMTIGSGEDDLLKVICHVLGVKDPSTLDPHSTLGDLGMDSLMAVEIRQGLERDYDVLLTAQEVRSLKISDLQSFKRAEKKPAIAVDTTVSVVDTTSKTASNDTIQI